MQMMNRKEVGIDPVLSAVRADGDANISSALLLQELTHRICNELASAIGFAKLSAAQSENSEVKIAMAGMIQHISESARIYRALQIPVSDGWIDAAAYLRELCQSITGARLHHKGIELVFVECPLLLNASRCWRLGMIVSELITNASRHAFGDRGGVIEVELRNRGDFYAECLVTDNGTGSQNVQSGQGTRIVAALADSLNGKIELQFGARGTVAMVSFPLFESDQEDAEDGCAVLTSETRK